jgi:hypothetical protein
MDNGSSLPDWVTFNNEIRLLTGIAPKEISSYNFTLFADDLINLPVNYTFTLVLNN